MRPFIRTTLKALPALFFLLSGGNATADTISKTPKDLSKMLVYVSTTPFTPIDGTFFVDGMQGDGMHFQREILQRSDSEIELDKADAINFLQTRFGVDVNDPRVHFMGFEVLPELQNRAVVVSGEHVPPEGWPMHDGGWIAIVIDPQGMDLGGEFAGTHVPAGTLFVRGNYLIDRKPNPLLLGCLAQRPIVPEASGAFELLCDISSKEYGQGQAIGGILPMPLADGRMLINARSVITFPKPGKASHWE